MWKALAGLLFFGVILVAPPPAWAQPCGGGRVPAPTLVAPAPDAQGVSLTPTLVVQPGTPLGREGAPRCVPWRAWFQVSTHPEFRQESIVFFGMLSAEDGGAIDRVTLPAGELRTNTRYHWRVAVSGKEEREGDPRGSPSGREVFSEYAPPRVFTTLPCHLPAAFNAAPADQAELLAPPTLRLETDGAAGAPTCQPNFTTWQVAFCFSQLLGKLLVLIFRGGAGEDQRKENERCCKRV